MNNMKKLLPSTIAAVVAASALSVSVPASADLSASASVANMYFWRGQDLGGGAAMSADLVYSHDSGLSGGLWTSSGDGLNGTEYDLFVDFTREMSGVSLGAALWSYQYAGDPKDELGDIGNLSELILTGGWQGISFSYYVNLAHGTVTDAELNTASHGSTSEYSYWTLGYTYDKYSAKIGQADDDGPIDGYMHLDLSYAFNDNLSFTASSIVGEEEDDTMDTDLKVVVSYSIPLK